MKAGYLGRPATFIFVLSYFAASFVRVEGFQLLDLEVDETDLRQKHGHLLTEEILVAVDDESKSKTCADLSFGHPLQCIKNGCRLNPLTGECRHDPGHAKRRVKRDSKLKCSHYNTSPTTCLFYGCKYTVKRQMCLNADGSEDPEAEETQKSAKLERKGVDEGVSKGRSHGEDSGNGQDWGRGIVSEERDGRGIVSEERGDGTERERNSLGRSLTEKAPCSKFSNDQEKCVSTRVGCLFNETSKECIEAKAKTGNNSNSEGGDDSTSSEPFGRSLGRDMEFDKGESEVAPERHSGSEGGGVSADDSNCAKHNGKRKSCLKAHCEYCKSTKTCSAPEEEDSDNESSNEGKRTSNSKGRSLAGTRGTLSKKRQNKGKGCGKHDRKPRPCISAGCKYNKDKTCTRNSNNVHKKAETRTVKITTNRRRKLDSKECHAMNGYKEKCTDAGCQYKPNTKKCIANRGEAMWRGRGHKESIVSESNEEDKLGMPRRRAFDDYSDEYGPETGNGNEDYWNQDEIEPDGENEGYSHEDGRTDLVRRVPMDSGTNYDESEHSEEGGCSEHTGKPLSCRKQPGCAYHKTTKECSAAKTTDSGGYVGLFYLFPVNGKNGNGNWAQQMKNKVNNVIDAMNS